MKSFTSPISLDLRPPVVEHNGVRNLIFIIFFLLSSSFGLAVKAQNLVSNAGFETYTQLPTLLGQLSRATGWTNPMTIQGGSPDYWNTSGANFSISDKIGPRSGTGYVGTYLETKGTTANLTDYKEYMTVQLPGTLLAGATYVLSFYTTHLNGVSPTRLVASNPDNELTYVDLPSDEQGYLGAVFSADAPTYLNTVGSPSPRYTSIRDDFGSGRTLIPKTNTAVYVTNIASTANNWVKVTLLYKAVGNERFMTIGQLRPGTTALATNEAVYYTYDDFSLSLLATPGGVSAPDFWVKADDAGTIATAWTDHSANADHIANVGGMILSSADRAHNFHPFTTGYTTSKLFYNTASAMNPLGNVELPNTSTSIFSAVRPTTVTNGRITGIDDDTNGAEPGVSIAAGKPRQYEFTNSITSTDFSTGFNIGSSNIFSAIANNAVANGGTSTSPGGEKRLGLNGIYETTPFTGTNRFQIYGRNLRVGHAGWDAGGAFPGDIMEVIWYKRALSANEQSRVNTYLAVKNGVTSAENYLTSNSNIVWDVILNNGYNNNIFGIAKDDVSALHQKQSGSVNNAQKLVISTTGFANSNAANSVVLTTDQQYLMTGDNGLEQRLKTPLVFTGGTNGPINFRFESIWKVQNTGNVGTVTVAWPKGLNNLYLVQSPDAVFDDTDTFTPMVTEATVNGVVYNTTNVTLANGEFFTFAAFSYAPAGVTNGITYWYRGDKSASNTGDGTDVTTWVDQWSGNTVSSVAGNSLPKYKQGAVDYFNFNAGVNFTTINETIGTRSAQTIFNANNDLFMVTKEGMTSPGGSNPHFFSIGMDNVNTTIDNWDYLGIWPTGQVERRVYNGATNYPTVSPAHSTTIPSIMYYNFLNQPYSRGLNGAVNGATFNSPGAMGIPLGGHIFGSTKWTGSGSDNDGFIGHIAETIIYGSGNISSTERRRVDSYLAIKYGITLGRVNTDHYLNADAAMVWNGATNTAYNNNIFGIAREDIGLFEQKVSKSVNAGTILTVATTTDFVNPNDNAARTSFADDKTYLLLGDNNNVLLPLTSITVNGFTGGSRIQRQWLAQPTNAVGTVNFGADLSTYGGGFVNGAAVKMMVADNATFTANVEYIAGTFDATSGKWVHPYTFAAGQNKYITYVTANEVACTTGCNDNTFLNASDPNNIEYDNLIATDIAIVAKEKDGTFKIWGFKTSPNTSPSNSNLALDLLAPTAITPANGFNYTGTPLKVAITSNHANTSSVLLTTDGLYTWGSGELIPHTRKNTNQTTPAFSKVTINGKADGLPSGISPTNVKMMFGNPTGLAIVTCSGEAWMLANASNQYLYGDGMTASTANTAIWHRVMISATEALNDIVAVRGTNNTKFVLTSTGKLYTWGANTFIGNGTGSVSGTVRDFATEVTVPAGITPKMIGMSGNASYFVLGTNGRLYAMGQNTWGVLGDGTQTTSLSWKEVTATSGTHTLGGNIVWISPGEHSAFSDSYPTINVLTNEKKQWGWGSNHEYKLGQTDATGSTIYHTPIYMPGNSTTGNPMILNDEIIAVETGGKITMNYKSTTYYYGFIGATNYGTIGNGTTGLGSYPKYTYNTAILDLCGAFAGNCTNPGIFDAPGLPSTTGISSLAGFAGGTTGWPANVPNGHIVIESKNKGFVITRVSSSAAITNPVEGMLIYDIAAACVKLYNGTVWNCLAKDCIPLTN